ncbi:hypothetical protein K438DRAFT_2085607 [Mycena galopus ATCC 62051]|nr:hypothetical protein K438DRAFT_2085607 [Mycena galopus ATCC 62051]
MTDGGVDLSKHVGLAFEASTDSSRHDIDRAQTVTNTNTQAMDIDEMDWGDDEGLGPGVPDTGDEDHDAFIEQINTDAEALVGGREISGEFPEAGDMEAPTADGMHSTSIVERPVTEPAGNGAMDNELTQQRVTLVGGGRVIGLENAKVAADLERARLEIVKQKEEVIKLKMELRVAEHDACRSAKELKGLREAHDDVLREEAVAKTDLLWERSRIRGLEDRWSRERHALEDKVDALEKELSGYEGDRTHKRSRHSLDTSSYASTPAKSASIALPGTADRGEQDRVEPAEQAMLITTTIDQDVPMDTVVYETGSAAVQLKGNGPAVRGAIRGHGRSREAGGIMTSEMFSPSQVKMRPVINGKQPILPLDLHMKRPPTPKWNIERGGLFRGYPADPQAWKITHDLQLDNNGTGKAITVTVIGGGVICLPGLKLTNEQMRAKWPHVKMDEIGYHPARITQLFQVREWTKIRGCPFVDDCWTLYMPWVRGWNLVHQAGMETVSEPSLQTERTMKIKLDKLLFQIIGTPGLYASRHESSRISNDIWTRIIRTRAHQLSLFPSGNPGLDPQLTIQATFGDSAAGPTHVTNLDGLNLHGGAEYGTTFTAVNTDRMLAEISTAFGDPTMGNEPTYNFLNDE